MRDEFLSEEDLDLQNLTFEELVRVWDAWLRQAQSTNDLDEHRYSHGVVQVEPGWEITPDGVRPVARDDRPAAGDTA